MDRIEIYDSLRARSFVLDMKDGTDASLQLKSNIFSPIDKITLNHSFSVTVPDTLNNRRAFGCGNIPAVDADAVRAKYPCKFFRDGVLLFSGTCYVQGIENGDFSLLLMWGLDHLEALKDADLQDLDLGNMTFESDAEGKYVPKYATYAEAMEQIMFFAHSNSDCAAKNEYNLSATDQFTPCIAGRTLFKKCLEAAGIKYEVDAEKWEFMKSLAIPLATLDSGEMDIAVSGPGQPGEQTYFPFPGAFVKAGFYVEGFSTDVSNVSVIESKFTVQSSCNLKISYKAAFTTEELSDYTNLKIFIVQYDEDGNETGRDYKNPQYSKVSSNDGDLIFHVEDFEIEFDGKGEFYFVAFGLETTLNYVEVESLVAEFNDPPLTDGLALSIAVNLPGLSQINFIKAICQICGIFPIPPVDGSDVVRFVSADVLNQNKAKAVDWSGFVNSDAKKVSFAFSDYAQKNLITYKDGEDYAASFPMESPTADKEKTAIELPFMHLKGGRWPLWEVEYNKDKNVYEWSRGSVDPAIYFIRCLDAYETPMAWLSFDEITPTMILKRWSGLVDAVKRAKVIQVDLMIPQTAIKYIDYSIPVYIEQFGGYFGIVSLTAAGKKTTAELIKI